MSGLSFNFCIISAAEQGSIFVVSLGIKSSFRELIFRMLRTQKGDIVARAVQ